MPKRLIVFVILMLLAQLAAARMYQWQHPQTGKVQLSGTPPAWYRSIEPGPRILVFDNGQLVDDTRIAVNEMQRQHLRLEAFGSVNDDTALAGADTADTAHNELEAALDKASESGLDVATITAEFAERREAEASEQPAGDLSERVAQLKSLIEAWDTRQLESARAIVDQLPER